jgi:hypothetical protein
MRRRSQQTTNPKNLIMSTIIDIFFNIHICLIFSLKTTKRSINDIHLCNKHVYLITFLSKIFYGTQGTDIHDEFALGECAI